MVIYAYLPFKTGKAEGVNKKVTTDWCLRVMIRAQLLSYVHYCTSAIRNRIQHQEGWDFPIRLDHGSFRWNGYPLISLHP